jgi:4-amino-4-deoxy-L-arabinose transferase-like glycosyltransferase
MTQSSSVPFQQQQVFRVTLLLLVLWGIWTLRLAAPYYGIQDAFRVWIPAAVQNYERYGTDQIGWMVTRESAPVDDINELTFYSHHPPLNVWLPTAFTWVLGNNEVAIRLVFPLAMMLAASGFYVFVRRLYDAQTALWALLLFGITPLIAYFQPSYGHDPLGFMALMLFAAVFVNWMRRETEARYAALILLTILAVWTAWPAVIFVGCLGIVGMIIGDWRQRGHIVLLGITSVVALVSMLLLYEAQRAGSIDSILNAYVWRTSAATLREGSEPFTALQWLRQISVYVLFFGSVMLVTMALLGLRAVWRKRRTSDGPWFWGAMLAGGVLYLSVFRNASFIHDYYSAFLIPALTIPAALFITHQRRRRRRLSPLRLAGVAGVILQSVLMLGLLLASTNQPTITTLIDEINTTVDPAVPVTVVFPALDGNSGYDRVVEYYTERAINWNGAVPADGVIFYCNTQAPDHAVPLGDSSCAIVRDPGRE